MTTRIETMRGLRRATAVTALFGAAACGPTVEPAAAPSPARLAPPPPLTAVSIDFPEFREVTLPNGLPVLVIERRGQPLVSLSMYVRSGTATDPAERAGLAAMTAEVLTKGTTSRSALELAETIEGVGGTLNASAGGDWSSVSSSVLTEHLPLAFELLADVVQRPTFPEDEFQVTRRRTLSGLQAELGQPGSLAQRRFLRAIYGDDHPYGTLPVPGTVEAISRDDLVRFHRDHFTAGNAMLVVAGDLDLATAERLARQHFGEWRAGTRTAATFPQPPAIDATRIHLVHRPGSVQSNIRIGHLAIRPDNPDYFPLVVLNSIVGGGTDARLFQILREEKGWTYGAYSQLTRSLDIGAYVASAEVRTEVTDSALVEMIRQFERIRDERVPDEEFEANKSFLAGSFPLRIETAGQVAGQVAQTRLLGLPMAYVTEYRERIMAVTQDDVQRVAREYVRPDRAAIVIVGDATRVMPMIEGVAPISLYDIQGQPLDAASIAVRESDERFDGSRLQAQTLVYRLMVQGNAMGTATNRLVREGDAWIATSSLESPFMGQETEVRFGAADFTPISSRMTMSQGPMRIAVDLDVRDGRVQGRAEMPEQAGGNRDIDVEMVGGMLLPGMDAQVIAAADLEEGRTIELPVFDATSAAVTTVAFRVTGSEEVTVPAGTFPAYRVEVSGAQPMTLFVRRDAPHIMLRQEPAGMPVMIELESMD
jgi:zinc protease